ncbi:MAG: hypothetical protein OES38_03460 [Gammaproteobacteria bacterium]|nr:hypothetical protein [Gammaproteobacteria bacterium]
MTVADWLLVIGLGAIWHGAQIVWVGGLPRQLRRGETPTAEPGSPEAFGLFWIDQYGYIGLVLAVGGALLAGAGLLQS